MAEYIEREAAIEAVTVWYKKACQPKNMSSYNLDSAAFHLMGERAAYITAISEIGALLAADVRPVVRGKWVKARGSWCTPGGDPVWECSECGKGRHVYGIEHGSYGADVADKQWVACPNCGAMMEES